MKVLVVLCAVVASCLANHGFGYAYSAISPLTGYGSYAAPYSYAYSAPIISGSYAGPYAAPYAAAPVAIAPAPIAAPVKTQYHSQNEAGEAKYGHSEPLQRHDAVQDAHGNKVGSYSYVDPHGAVHQTNYVADGLGFRVAANDLPIAPAGPGPVVPLETPEVVAAKAHHFAAHATALHRYRRSALYSSNVHGWGIPAVLANGHIADTPEVAAAKAAHFAEVARASGHSGQYAHAAPAYSGHYAGPYAAPVVTPSGHLADTPEVAAAKAAHYAEHAKAAGHGYVAAPYAGHAATPYAGHYSAYTHSNGPWAVPVVKPDGFLADTPEVAAAKSAHLAELAHRGKRSIFYQTPASTSPLLPAPVAHIAPVAPVAYAAAIPHPAPLAYAAAPLLGVPAFRTDIVHTPGHAQSYRIDHY